LNEITQKLILQLKSKEYMHGIIRSKDRVKQTGEIFTPTKLVRQELDKCPQTIFAKIDQTFLDPSCGDGQFLAEVLIRKLENNIPYDQALSTIYGVDLMADNIKLCQDRLLCNQEQYRHIVENNIVCADALTYHYRFDGTDPTKTDNDLIFDKLFE